MAPRTSLIRPTLLIFLASGVSAQGPRSAACANLTDLRLPDTTILSASHVSPLTSLNVSTPRSCQTQALVTNSFCRVRLIINTTSTSSLNAEAWLPDTWFGRFLGLGNGGLGGCIDYLDLDYGTTLHFATVGSDNGHDGEGGDVYLDHPEVINDFAFRGLHVETVIGKQIVQAYYGKPHAKSYYLGCSAGGRMGTQAALKYPEDFDGIVAGAPATNWNSLLGLFVTMAGIVGAPDAPSFIPPALWDVVANEILKQCDGLDGFSDEIITEPDSCDFKPEAIQCTAQTTTNCLSEPQLAVLRKVYQPLNGPDGELIFPRYDPGAEVDGGWQILLNGSVNAIAGDWYKYAIFNNSDYDFGNFNLDDIALANRLDPGGISTFNSDLSAFHTRGGKFITYHGRQDQYIPSGNSKRVYNLISQTMGLPNLDAFYRLFLIPGMGHCVGGRGASLFGQVSSLSNVVNASSHNVLLAVVDWVEKGVAPDTITGTGLNLLPRTHCRYPQKSVIKGLLGYVCEA
ncbi:tannase and feruloyl esterase [Lyophyllum atratum]|nr:tannase and feruloyl esterase [Lyophyllum atratum]